MGYRQRIEDLTDAILAIIAEQTDDATADDLYDQVEILAQSAMEIHSALSDDDDSSEENNEDDFLDFRGDMDNFSLDEDDE